MLVANTKTTFEEIKERSKTMDLTNFCLFARQF